jgi:hypothetical protein
VQKVLETLGGHQGRARPPALEECVRRNRRSVREAVDAHGADGRCGSEHGLLLARSRRHLRRPQRPVRDEDGVRERPSDVDPEGTHARILP